MNLHENKYHGESGAVFFYIMIAVALLAALSYALSQGNRGSTSTLTNQQAKLAAQEIIEYGQTVANAVQKLKLRGCADTQISFANDVWRFSNGTLIHAAGHNPNTPGNQCEVFHPDGGNISAKILPFRENLTVAPGAVGKGHSIINTIDVVDVGTAERELVLLIEFVPREACTIINDQLGAFNSDDPPLDGWAGAGIYNGSYVGTAQIGDQEPAIAGRLAACLQWPGGGYGDDDIHFYQVLIAR